MTAKRMIFVWGLSLWLALAITGCSTRPASIFSDGDAVFGLSSPITLQPDTTRVVLNDFFLTTHLERIDSISGHGAFRFLYDRGRQQVTIAARSLQLPLLSEMTVWMEDEAYSIMLKRSQKEQVIFTFDPGPTRYRTMAIRGEMTDWVPAPMNLIDGKWTIRMNLNPGRYQYLLVANGRDMLDPANADSVSNNAGGFNSLVAVGQQDREQAPRLLPENYRKGRLQIRLENQADEIFVLWQNFRVPAENIARQGDHLQVLIPGDAWKHQRSHLRVMAYNSQGVANDLLIPLEYGAPVLQAQQLTREDREATILYFLMVDRFNNGNLLNDDPVNDPEVAPRANYHGGDLYGVAQKIQDGYFSDLGVNAIWFSPITQNPLEAYVEFPEPKRKYTGYHGYWPITLTTIDHRFGNDSIMEVLVQSAHDRQISVLLDFVSNHVHKNNPLIQQNPDWATQFILEDGRRNIRIWDEQRETTWFDDFLPSLDFSKPEVIEVMADSAFYWVQRFNLDGFRHDATKHVPLTFWRHLTRKLKEEKMVARDFRLFQIGETFGSRELIGNYVGSGMLDGQFDFNLYWDARSVFALDDQSFERLDFSLQQSFNYYGYQNLMGNITGNHDMPRFISYAGGGLRFDEHHTEAGWNREVGVGDPVGYNKLSALTAFIMTIPGVPVIYYGDEIGIPGANDPDSRRPMRFENLSPEENQVRENVKKLTRIRANNLAFVYGDFRSLLADQAHYVYARSYFNHHGLVCFNKSNQISVVEIPLPAHLSGLKFKSQFGSEFSIINNVLRISLQPYAFEVLTH